MAAKDTAKSGSNDKGGAKGKDKPPSRTPAQVQADLIATRERMTASVETLIDTVHPSRIKQRQVDSIKQFANAEVENAKSLVFNAKGDLRTERLAVIGAAAAGAVTFLVLVGKLARRVRG